MAHWVENENAEWKIMANTCILFDCTYCLEPAWAITSLYMTTLDGAGNTHTHPQKLTQLFAKRTRILETQL